MLKLLSCVAWIVQLAAATVVVTSIVNHPEFNCSTTLDFSCDTNLCIPIEKRCDGYNDCWDLSDEMDCEMHLCEEPYWFTCKNKKCISKSFVCDDENDCGDFSDEQNCSSWKISTLQPFPNCSANEWRCSDRLCIPTEWVCNGEPDCLDASDENIGCKNHYVCDGFKCKNSQCIPKEWRCDKTTDCKDGSDELNCDILPENCSLDKGLFQCLSDNNCIQISEVCDGIVQCQDKSDESTLCADTSCKSQSNCSHNCITTPHGIRCLCPHGYYATDTGNCTDIDECKIYGICDQMCRNLEGSHECYCEQKYILQDDKRTCTVKDGEPLMIFSTKNEIRGYFLKSQLYFPIAKQLKQAIGVSFDGNYVYWTEISSESESIVRALEDGTHKQVLLTSGLGTPEDISIDWVTGNIYFTDSEMQHIAVCTNEGIYCTILINQAVHKPRSIVLNPLKGEMYWSDWGDRPEIARANMDGTKDISFVANEIYWPNGLALDTPNQRLYWTDAKSLTIESIKLDGSGRRVIAKGIVKHPYGLAVFENRIYWSDWSTHSIESCDKFTGRDHNILIKQTHEYIYDIHIYHSALQLRRSNNPCKFAFCSDICLLTGKSYSCACPDNKIMDADKHTCKVAVRDQQLIIGTSKSLLLMQYQQLGQHNSTNISVTFENITALAYNSANHSLFISDYASKMLAVVDIYNGHTDYLLTEADTDIVAMDFDALGNNLFWCDSKKAVVEVLNLNTMSRKVILSDMVGETPIAIAVVSDDGIMFVAFQTSKHSGHIDRLRLDGSERTHIIEQGLMGPIHLLYDMELHRVFWADSGSGLIESTSIDGDDRHEFRMLEGSPSAIASLNKNIFWVNRKSKNLYWASKMDSDKNNKRIAVDFPGNVEILHLIAVTPQKISTHPCQQNNGNCSHLCLPAVGTVICACPLGMKLESNNKTCTKPRFCALNEFLCRQSNICISNTMHCDQRMDCMFGEDEKDCDIRNKCPSGHFQCQNNECIKDSLICDKHYDCKDNSDEASCAVSDNIDSCHNSYSNCFTTKECLENGLLCNNRNITCSVNHFRCNSGACIPKNWECDHEFDCRDLSDEHKNCGYTVCRSPKFQCSNGLCIDSVLKCNGVNDCGDYSDEIHCVVLNHELICKANEFHCYSNHSLCLPISSRCNGTSECPHHEDEQGCSNCHMDKFECSNKKCIDRQWLCDHVDDCGDNSDETLYMCLHEQTVLSQNSSCHKQFRCKNGQCIDMSAVCNTKDDCGDGSDEDGACFLSCAADNNPCSHICMRTPTGPQCSCNSGFKLRGDGRTCTDLKECLLEPPVCSQNCNEISGSYSCSCYDGYILRSDGTSCKTIEDGMSLIFATSMELYRLFYANNTLQVLHSNADAKITGIDISAERKFVYFGTESNKLYRLNLLHQAQEYISDVGQPHNLAVEWISENIYFVNDDLTSKSIRVCNFEKRSCADVLKINYHSKVLALSIDAVNHYIFYSQSSSWKSFSSPNSVIYKCNLDGSNLQQLFSSNNEYITGLTSDVRRNILYYGDSYNGKIFKINYDGTNQAEIISNLTRPMSLSVFENHLYFYTAGGYMTMCPLFKNYQACKSYRVYGRFNDMFVILHTSRQPLITNVCQNHNCTHLCISQNNTARCVCSSNLMKSDLLQCQNKQITSIAYQQQSKYESKKETSSRKGNLTITLIVMTGLFAIISCISGYYYFHKKRSGNFSISMRFQNPVYGYIQENSQEIVIRPGQHEYYNPINSIAVVELKNKK